MVAKDSNPTPRATSMMPFGDGHRQLSTQACYIKRFAQHNRMTSEFQWLSFKLYCQHAHKSPLWYIYRSSLYMGEQTSPFEMAICVIFWSLQTSIYYTHIHSKLASLLSLIQGLSIDTAIYDEVREGQPAVWGDIGGLIIPGRAYQLYYDQTDWSQVSLLLGVV